MFVIIFTWILKDKSDCGRLIIRTHGDLVVSVGTTHDLGETANVDAKGDGTVTTVALKTVALEVKGDESNVGGVHGLEVDALAVALKVGLVHKVLDGIENLLQKRCFGKYGFKHFYFILFYDCLLFCPLFLLEMEIYVYVYKKNNNNRKIILFFKFYIY